MIRLEEDLPVTLLMLVGWFRISKRCFMIMGNSWLYMQMLIGLPIKTYIKM